MTIFLMILKKYWKHVLIVVVLLVLSWMAYSKIYNIGFEAANIACEKRIQEYSAKMKEYEDNLDKRIAGLEEASNILVTEAIESRKVIKKDFSVILASIKGKPLYIIEQGKCSPSTDFVRAYNESVERANKP
jgi:hypothetical protein